MKKNWGIDMVKKFADEVEEVKQLVDASPKDPELRLRLGNLYLEGNLHLDGDCAERAKDEFVYALSIDRDNILAHVGLAQAESLLGNRRRSEQIYDNILNLYDRTRPQNPEIMAEVARILYYDKGEKEMAFELLNDAMNLDENNFTVNRVLAGFYSREERFEESERHQRIAMKNNPDHEDTHYDMMVVLSCLDRSEESCEQSIIRWKLLEERFYPHIESPFNRTKKPDDSIEVEVCEEKGVVKIRKYDKGQEDWSVREDVPLEEWKSVEKDVLKNLARKFIEDD